MNKHLASVLLSTLLLAQQAYADVHTAANQIRERRINWRSGAPLSTRLLPDDRTVIVEKVTSHEPPFRVGPPLTIEEELRQLGGADAVIVVKITSVDAELTPASDWIRTRVRGAIEEPVKIPAWPLLDNKGLVEFEVDGGELRFKDIIVRAGSYPMFRTGATYLLTLVADRHGVWRFSQHFLIDGEGRLVRPALFDPRGTTLSSPIFGLPQAEVTQKLKRR